MDSPYLDVQILAAVDAKNHCMTGAKNSVKSKEDMRFFKKISANSCVIMSHSVYESAGKPLGNRVNMVITEEEGHDSPGYMVAENLYEAIRTARMFPSIFVVGSPSLVKESFEYANTLWLTRYTNDGGLSNLAFPKLPKQYELETSEPLADGVVLEKWINPDRYVKLYKAPKQMR